jgi:predicted membrane chloride channel (bestrophin family)
LQVCFVSLIVYFINLAILSGAAQPLLAPELSNLLSLPTLPFQLSSPALALLLVFRNNAVYTRWTQARMSWERIQGQVRPFPRALFIFCSPPFCL